MAGDLIERRRGCGSAGGVFVVGDRVECRNGEEPWGTGVVTHSRPVKVARDGIGIGPPALGCAAAGLRGALHICPVCRVFVRV